MRIHLASGKKLTVDRALYSIGRTGATSTLNLESVGIKPDSRGRLTVSDTYQTIASHIYAVGDVIGFPSLASTSLEQGRLAACHAFGVEAASELIHIGQAVIAFWGTMDYFINTVFNYPTLAECYKTAAFDGINRLGSPQDTIRFQR